jgi:hypothetical protein
MYLIVERLSMGRHPGKLLDAAPYQYKTNDQANLLGSTLFLYLAHLLSLRQRRRTELSTLYEPLSDSSTYRDSRGRQHAFGHGDSQPPREAVTGTHRARAGSNVWDEASDADPTEMGRRSEVFEIGGEDDDEDDTRRRGDRDNASSLV